MLRVLSRPERDLRYRQMVRVVDLQGLSFEECEEQLELLWDDYHGHPMWDEPRREEGDGRPEIGLRIVVYWERDADGFRRGNHPLEDPSPANYGLHPKYGFETIWFCSVYDHGLMYIVRPVKKRLIDKLKPMAIPKEEPKSQTSRSRSLMRWLLPSMGA